MRCRFRLLHTIIAERRRAVKMENCADVCYTDRKSAQAPARGTERGFAMRKKERAEGVIAALEAAYPGAVCALHFQADYQLMIAVRLSAQCTDARVNLVTPALFAAYPTLHAFAQADVADIERLVHSCGFYQHKARDIVLACQMLERDFGGRVPDTMEDLLKLPGVGRKTANLLLGDLYGKEAYVCDTHCIRIAGRLGLTDGTKDPLKCELQLRKLIPPEKSSDFCHRIVLHGRAVCTARSPRCGECTLAPYCKSFAGK